MSRPPHDWSAVTGSSGHLRIAAGAGIRDLPSAAGTTGSASFAAMLEASGVSSKRAASVDGHRATGGGLLAGGTVAALGQIAMSSSSVPVAPPSMARGPAMEHGGNPGGLVWPGMNPGTNGQRRSSPHATAPGTAQGAADNDAIEPRMAVFGIADDDPMPPA